jgi:tetratricopeptide (TPR) repeat protein
VAPAVQVQELSAQQLFERGIAAAEVDEKLRLYSASIRLKPDYAVAFLNRGLARHAKGDLDGALQDYDEALRIQPGFALAFNNRGVARKAKGDLDGALQDYNEALRIQPGFALAVKNRAALAERKAERWVVWILVFILSCMAVFAYFANHSG